MKVSRLNSIEQYVISRETVSIDELCEVFGVSKNTIRRDLNELEQRGHITKVYGGVTATVPFPKDRKNSPPHNFRQKNLHPVIISAQTPRTPKKYPIFVD